MNIWKPFVTNTTSSVGIDVGIKDIAILSDGTKYENKRFQENESERLKALNRRLSRREGYSNYKFREKQKSDRDIVPSKRYLATQKTIQELEREVHRKRNDYYHNISRDIIEQNNFIGVESLNISGMMKNHHIAKALSDASMHTLLQMLKYKSDWHHRTIQPIDQWKPSSKRCSVCGYLYPDMTLAVREWTCPECGTRHDRDINAAKNILHFAMEVLE
jgi:putative transposase